MKRNNEFLGGKPPTAEPQRDWTRFALVLVSLWLGPAPIVNAGLLAATQAWIHGPKPDNLNANYDQNNSNQALGSSVSSADTGQYQIFEELNDSSGSADVPIIWEGEYSALGTGIATYGSLHASASVTFEANPITVSFLGRDSDDNPYLVTAVNPVAHLLGFAAGGAQFEDAYTVQSTTLSAGSIVLATFTATFHGSSTGGVGSLVVYNSIFSGRQIPLYRILNGIYDTPGNQGDHLSVTEQLIVGQTYYLTGSLFVTAQAPSPPCLDTFGSCGFENILEDAGNTANFFVDPQSPDFTLAFASGNSYASSAASAVPEPSTFLLVAGALTGLVFFRRRHGRNRFRKSFNAPTSVLKMAVRRFYLFLYPSPRGWAPPPCILP